LTGSKGRIPDSIHVIVNNTLLAFFPMFLASLELPEAVSTLLMKVAKSSARGLTVARVAGLRRVGVGRP